MSFVSINLVCDSSIVATCPSIQLPALLFVCVLFVLFLLFVVVLSGEPNQNQGRGLVDRKLVDPPPPVILLLAVPRRLFCFWFFDGFRCGVPLFIVIRVIYKYKNR